MHLNVKDEKVSTIIISNNPISQSTPYKMKLLDDDLSGWQNSVYSNPSYIHFTFKHYLKYQNIVQQ